MANPDRGMRVGAMSSVNIAGSRGDAPYTDEDYFAHVDGLAWILPSGAP